MGVKRRHGSTGVYMGVNRGNDSIGRPGEYRGGGEGECKGMQRSTRAHESAGGLI